MNASNQDPAERPAPANDSAIEGETAAMPGEQSRLAELEAEIASLKDQYLRAVAEAENIRRRGERERQDVAKYAATNLARDMLPVGDNLRRALDALPPDARSDDAVRSFVEGVELTERELLAAFGRHGIERIAPIDVPFDPNRHQAMFEVPGSGKPNGTVVQCLQAGWVMHDRLLRPALVGVAKGAAPAPAAASRSPIADDEPTLG
ncbi:protein GrpE [Allostella vacuolata]|nr:protein GrpE [Stella vacuolata]